MSELLYVMISQQIEKQIQEGILKEKDRLSERKLAEAYSVSRTVIREALKLLNEKGLVEIVYGKGNFVCVPDNSIVMDKFINSIHNSSLRLEDIVEAREILESVMAEYIIDRRDEQDIEDIEQLLIKMEASIESQAAYAELDAAFHDRLMKCLKNEVLELVMGALNSLTNRRMLYPSLEDRISTHDEHKQILYRLKAHDRVGLRSAVLDHISCARGRMGITPDFNDDKTSL